MSLIIATKVKDGLVVAADTRTTCKYTDSNVRYSDSEEKIILFPNKTVVLHCGDASLNNHLTIRRFLYDLKSELDDNSNINDIPIKILNAYIQKGGNKDTIFIVAGVLPFTEIVCVYVIKTKTKEIECKLSLLNYGATYFGKTSIAHSIMNFDIDYDNLTINEAIEITRNAIEETILVSKFSKQPVVGGHCQVYVIDTLHKETGWLNEDNTLRKDEIRKG